MFLRIFLFIILVEILFSCANLRVRAYEKKVDDHLNISGELKEIEIIDKRTDISSEIKLPVFSRPGQVRTQKPPLDSSHRHVIEKVLKENFSGDGMTFKMKVFVNEGIKGFYADAFQEHEFAKMNLLIEVKDSTDKIVFCNADATYKVSSSDATYKRLERIYRLCFKNAVYKGLKCTKSD